MPRGPQSVGKGVAFSDGESCGLMRALVVRLRRPTRTLFGREVFSPTHRSPGKTDFIFFAPAGANSARLFQQAQGPAACRGALFSILHRHAEKNFGLFTKVSHFHLTGKPAAFTISKDNFEKPPCFFAVLSVYCALWARLYNLSSVHRSYLTLK